MSTSPSTTHLLKRLRGLMQASSINAYIIPSEDAHQSEYLADCDMRRQFISKFTGSSGTAIVTLDKAALWTDGRYHLQAANQLDLSSWTLMKDGLPDTPTQSNWLKDTLKAGDKVGFDPFLISHETYKRLSKDLRQSCIQLVGVKDNLVDQVWEDKDILVEGVDVARPPKPNNKLIKLDVDITGQEWTDKVADLRKELEKKKTSAIVISALDDIAWLLNLRGSDIDFNPVFFAYCVVTMTDVYLFIDQNKITTEVRQAIKGCAENARCEEGPCVRLADYGHITDFVATKLVPSCDKQLIWVCSETSEAIMGTVPKGQRFMEPSPITKMKAIKNETEIENMINCHIRDAAALCEYLAWLETTIEANPDGHEELWEIQGADYLEKCRKQQDHFMGLSFPSISASGPNGAIIHYDPEPSTRRPIGKNEMYLIDSGAQYLDGTTDVTRTVHYGTPSDKERGCFTRVLKGHIQLAMSVFPRLTKGSQLDGFARRALWSEGLEYMHGTGHGVGMFLNVHEGPCAISSRSRPTEPGLEANQVLSNEPGYYEAGEFGIRIESLVVTRKAETQYNFNNIGFLKFETITLVPIQLKLIDKTLLTDEEIAWLNEYHATCRRVVGDYLLNKLKKPHVNNWLVRETEPLKR